MDKSCINCAKFIECAGNNVKCLGTIDEWKSQDMQYTLHNWEPDVEYMFDGLTT